ncbi:MAG TPA: hypothetical protein DCG49_11075, partial [Ruminococcus sp.]|nr:hypothetical protein [Ruminococcus sp.]
MRRNTKRAAAALTALVIAAGAAHAIAAGVGDLNGDGSTNITDAKLLQGFLLGKDSSVPAGADVNGDGRVNAADLSVLKQNVLNPPQSLNGDIPDLGTKPDQNADMFSDFKSGDAGDFFASDGWTNEKPFDCWWYKKNAVIKDGSLQLSIDRKWNPNDKN